MNRRNIKQQIGGVVPSLALCIIGVVALSSCRGEIKISQIEVIPSTNVSPGSTAEVSVTIYNAPSDFSSMRFEWNAKHGELYPEITSTPNSQYTAPNTPGRDVITLKILLGDKILATKSKTIIVGREKTDISAIQPSGTSQKATNDKTLKVSQYFFPSGWMGDGEGEEGTRYIRVDSANQEKPHSPPTCYKWTVRPGPKQFAAVAWQYPDGNFGKEPGYNLTGYAKVTFLVKGQNSREVLQFKALGHTEPDASYPASSSAVATQFITLTTNWEKHEIDLTGQNLSNVPCAFVWVATAMYNPGGCTFYLDDIRFEN